MTEAAVKPTGLAWLSPLWCEVLMGAPPGWTDLPSESSDAVTPGESLPSGTPSFQASPGSSAG